MNVLLVHLSGGCADQISHARHDEMQLIDALGLRAVTSLDSVGSSLYRTSSGNDR